MSDFEKLAAAIRVATDSPQAADVDSLIRRVKALVEDRDCWRENYRVLHREYLRMDDILRGRFWWKLLRKIFPLRVRIEWRKS